MANVKKKKKPVVIIVIILIIIAVIVLLAVNAGKSVSSMQIEETAEKRDISTYKTFTGNVSSDKENEIFAGVTQKVLTVNVKKGDFVNKGDVIAVLDSTEIEKSISVRESTMSNSELSDSYNVRTAKQTYEDYLASINNGTNSQLNSAKSAYETAERNLEIAEKKYNEANSDYSEHSDSTVLNAENKIKTAKLSLESAEQDYKTAKKEYEDRTASSLVSAENQIKTAKLSLDNAKSELEYAKKEYEDYALEKNSEDYASIKSQKDAKEDAYKKYNEKLKRVNDAQYSSALQRYNNAKLTYEHLQQLYSNETTSQYVSESDLKAAEKELQDSKAALDNLNYSDKSLADLRKDYDEAVKDYDKARKDLDDKNDDKLKNLERTYNSCERSYNTATINYESALENLTNTEKQLKKGVDSYYDAYLSAKINYESSLEGLSSAERSLSNTIDSCYDNYVAAKKSYDDAAVSYESAKITVSQTLDSYKTAYDKAVELSGISPSEMNELDKLYKNLEKCNVVSEYTGYISTLNLVEGGYSSETQPAAVVTDYDELKITIRIDEYDVNSVKEDHPVSVYINALEKSVEGKIMRVSKQASVSNGVSYFEADVSFARDDDIKAGMSTEVRLTDKEVFGAVSLSVKAIQFNDDNTAYVQIKTPEGEVIKKDIKIGVSDGKYAEITEGISDGETVFYMPASFNNMDMLF